jgi:hypothetical protein
VNDKCLSTPKASLLGVKQLAGPRGTDEKREGERRLCLRRSWSRYWRSIFAVRAAAEALPSVALMSFSR